MTSANGSLKKQQSYMKKRRNKTENDVSGLPKVLPGATLALVVSLICYQLVTYYARPAEEEMPLEQFVRIKCSNESYEADKSHFYKCIPTDKCGRYATRNFISEEETDLLLDFAKRAFSLTKGGSGGATIYDLASSAVSTGETFASIWSISGHESTLSQEDYIFFNNIQMKVKQKISEIFGVSVEDFYLTRPCFFSRLNEKPAKTLNDEYWHRHIDKETYGKFIYTALIYLSNHGSDFEGGHFKFVGGLAHNQTVTPKKGLFSTFSSGSENPHLVERVTSGERYALTIAFACDPSGAIEPPRYAGH